MMANISASLQVAGKLLRNESLKDYTSWRTGGCGEYVYLPAHLDDLAAFLKQLPTDMPLTWLGLGSNTLIRDGGVKGVVIITQGALAQMHQLQAHVIRAEAGVACAQLARHSARQSGAGLEFLAGIPGTVGGALAMNAGCFGVETWQRVVAVETINRQGIIQTRTPAEFEIRYRHVSKPADEWFVAGHFATVPGDKETSLQQIKTLIEKRNQTQPTGTANCGSVFRNPPGDYAGRLIEASGLKGKTLGGAAISVKHANFILNEGEGRAADIEALIQLIIATVKEKTGVTLLPEVCMIGYA